MSARRASISANLRADATGWKKGCDAARAETMKLKQDVEKTKIHGPSVSTFVEKWKSSSLAAKGAIAGGVVAAAVAATAAVAKAPVWMQDLEDGLTSFMGSADKATAHMEKLRAISNEFGVSDAGLEMMEQASIRMQSLGYSADFAADFIREAANSAEFMGKNFEDMEPVFSALDKIDQKGEASVKMIAKLSETIPEFRTVIEKAFGVSTAHELEALGLSARELTEGILNGMKQVEDQSLSTAELALAQADRIKQQTLNRARNAKLGDAAKPLDPRNVMTDEEGKKAREGIVGGAKGRLDDAAKKEQDEKNDAAREAVRIAGMEASAQDNINELRARGDEKAAAAIEDRIKADKEIRETAEKYKVSQESITEQIEAQVKAHRAAVNDIESAKAQTEFTKKTRDQELETLRAHGKTKKANHLEDDREIAEITKGGHVSESDARNYVQQKRANADATERAAAGLRPRIHGRGRVGDGGRSRANDAVNNDGGMQGGLGGFHSDPANFSHDQGIPYFNKGRQDYNPIGGKALGPDSRAATKQAKESEDGKDPMVDILNRIEQNTRQTPAQKHAPRKP